MTETSLVHVGPYNLIVEKNGEKILKVSIFDQPLQKAKNLNTKSDHIAKAFEKFTKGNVDAFTRLELETQGTAFQKKVWKATQKIPYGETRTYGELAKQVGHPKAARAVGTVMAKNPVCVIVPCHRVVPSSGGIGNYAYGKAMKKWLLDHEKKQMGVATA